MCIVLISTSHPQYALIVLDNRDEYILRPTSRPHWWTARPQPAVPNGPANGTDGSREELAVLSSRDLYRAERGTWLGITKGGNFAVLTNYREMDTADAAHPVQGTRSRGAMVTAWLEADPAESTKQFVHRMLDDGGVKGVGGFSLLCGKLRKVSGEKNIQPLAIISNRCDDAEQVPWICGQRGSSYGLSNATYLEPSDENKDALWPKIIQGTDMLNRALAAAGDEQELLTSLFQILDRDEFPPNHAMDLEEGLAHLKNSIFIPAFGGPRHQQEMSEAQRQGNVKQTNHDFSPAVEVLTMAARPDPPKPNGFETGLYGTQRQTVILVDWDGNVTYVERALWDSNGNPIPRGQGDEIFHFKIVGWDHADELRN
ncbi:hypothetical protein N657DRAFT_564862 [Parathielavia appendiculata]|uniref:Uncharacterized protein n=1 Tax=Parathielavia appendiculata TaxID=2587402 RepID=A0AAN6U645_9PEZI|nr:hypothetical protein N657DRAFT_564862 [Parathielavia appendiculata]